MGERKDCLTPEPKAAVCPLHSGFHERIRDLEGRADSSARERGEMRDQIGDLRVAHATTTARWGVAIIIAQAVIAILVGVAVKLIVGG